MIRDTSRPAPSVHPQHPTPVYPVDAPPARSHWLAWLVFWAVLGTIGFFGYRAWERQRNKPPATMPAGRVTPVVAAVAKRGNLDLYLQELGTVTPLNTVTVRSRVGGELINVAFMEGQTVKAGDLLVEIDPRPFKVQLAQAQAQLGRDEALLTNAKADLERYEDAPETVTQQQIATQKALVAQFTAQSKTDQAAIDDANLQIQYCRITAPIGGRIGLRLVDLGNMIQANDATGIAVITQVQPISVIFSVAENEIGRVVRAMSSADRKLTVDAYDDDDRTKIATGVLAAIDNQVDPTTGTVRLRAEFPNRDGALYPNQFVRAHLLVDTVRDAVLIPTTARQLGPPPNTTYAYVVGADQTVELRNIKTGPSEGDQVVVLDGLKEGEIVVTDGVDKLVPGSKVTARLPGDAATSRPTPGRRGGRGGRPPSTRPAAGGPAA